MAAVLGAFWRLARGFRRRPVVLTVSLPPAECRERLAAATSSRLYFYWSLDARNVGQPEPLLLGRVSREEVSLARFSEAARRSGFSVWLEARLEAAADGGARLTGTVGFMPLFLGLAVYGCCFLTFVAVAGAVELVLHHGLAGDVLVVPVALAPPALIAGIGALLGWVRDRLSATLLMTVSEVLGSTAGLPVSDANHEET